MSLIWRIVKWLAVIWVLLVAVGFCSAAFAQALPQQVFPQSVAGNVTTFGATTATASNASSFTFGAPANGPLYATSPQSVSIGGGRTVTATVRAFPDALATSKAIGRFVLKVSTPLVVGVALYDLAKELGFDLDNSSGSLRVSRVDPLACRPSAPCYKFRVPHIGHPYYLASEWGASFPSWLIAVDGHQRIDYANCRVNGSQPPVTGTCSQVWGNQDNGHVIGQPAGPDVSWGLIYVEVTAPVSGTGSPSTVSELETAVQSHVQSVPAGSALPRAVADAIASGESLPLPKPAEITGPSSVTLPPEVVTNPDGSKVTTTPQKNLSYGPDSVTVTDTSTKVFTDPAGNTTGTSTTTKPAEVPEVKTCGYPGGPPCKIDEVGTPEVKPEDAYKASADAYKADVDAKRGAIGGTADKQFFTGWSMFFSAPPIAQCEAISLPDYNGASMGSINPCGTADAIRQVMAWLWALGGLWLCLGWVREVV